jgi:hypothetical protein
MPNQRPDVMRQARTESERSVLHAHARRGELPRRMDERQDKRLTHREVHAPSDRLFPQGLAGAEVLTEIAPQGWERSPLLACFPCLWSSSSRSE